MPVAKLQPTAITNAARDYYQNGYTIIRDMFSAAEIAALNEEAKQLLRQHARLMDTNNLRCRWQTDVETSACIFDAFDPVIDLGPVCARIANDPRIHELLTAIYGEPGCLFKDKLIFKPPGASGYAMHQDYIAWPTFPRSFLTVLVPIDPADSANGCTEVFPGYQNQGCLMPEDGEYHEIPSGTINESCGVKLTLAPGDVACFGGFMPHRSAPNHSRHWRRQLYLSYNAISDGGDYRDAHYREFHDWLRLQYAKYGRNAVYYE